jgi:ElaB/YqjD/DUF883 family membrane-anchored ribosome-binding protein
MNKDQLKEKTDDLQSAAMEAGRNIKNNALEWHKAARKNAGVAARATDTYVRDNPWGVIGMAAVFAFAFGLVIGRRK